jgi:hypothetical protein
MTSGPIPSAGIAAIEYSRMSLPRDFVAPLSARMQLAAAAGERQLPRVYTKN